VKGLVNPLFFLIWKKSFFLRTFGKIITVIWNQRKCRVLSSSGGKHWNCDVEK
jgi:hypothetical protein